MPRALGKHTGHRHTLGRSWAGGVWQQYCHMTAGSALSALPGTHAIGLPPVIQREREYVSCSSGWFTCFSFETSRETLANQLWFPSIILKVLKSA